MRVFVAGATGVLGRRILRGLVSRGHEVVGLSRSEAGDATIRSLGGAPARADLFDADALARASQGADAVVHAATAIPLVWRPRRSHFALNDRIRREGTRALIEAARRIGARRYVQQSVVWLAAPDGGVEFDESSPPNPDPGTLSAVDGEEIVLAASREGGPASAVLRCGVLYAPDAGHTRMLGEGLAARRFPVIGRGDAAWAMVHADDAAAAFVAAAERGGTGIWHVVDDEPVASRVLLHGFAARLRAPPPPRVPAWAARLLAGSYLTDLLTRPVVTSNARLRRDLGWTPRYPTWREGTAQVVEAWRREGFPPRSASG